MLCLIYSKDYCIVSSIYFISGQCAKLFCQVITKLLILCTLTGIQNKCQKYGMHFRATQVLSSLDGGSNLPPFSLIDIKMCRYIRWYSFGTGHFHLLVPTESILIPTGSLYTHRSQIVPPESKRYAHRVTIQHVRKQ